MITHIPKGSMCINCIIFERQKIMTKERELLRELNTVFQNNTIWQDHEKCSEIRERVREELAKPERMPLSDELLAEYWKK